MDKLAKIVMLLLLSAAFSFANWNGETSEPEITSVNDVDYYQISTPKELAWFAAKVNDGDVAINAQLTNDIVLWDSELSEESEVPHWTPIGFGSHRAFSGIFDGQNFKISGLYINDSICVEKGSFWGLFGLVDAKGVVQNLVVENSYVLGYAPRKCADWLMGGVVGFNRGRVQNVSFHGSVLGKVLDNGRSGAMLGGVAGLSYGTLTDVSADGLVECASCVTGGIAGFSSGLIEHCKNEAQVLGDTVGGILGYAFGGTVDSCTNNGNVKSSGESEISIVGGIAGLANGSPLHNCVNNGQVDFLGKKVFAGGIAGVQTYETMDSCTNNGVVNGTTSGVSEVGGIVGRFVGSEVYHVHNTADVSVISGDTSKVGGIVGYTNEYNIVEGSVNKGNVSVYAKESQILAYLGGVAGYMYGSKNIKNSINEGVIFADSSNVKAYAGGIVGMVHVSGEITECVNKGAVIASTYEGGIAGYAVGTLVIESCTNEGTLKPSLYGSFVNMGGIVGFVANYVSIHACANNGDLLFNGVNVRAGGIAGEANTSVAVVSCTNNGEINGTTLGYSIMGGIVGQVTAGTSIDSSQNNGDVLLNDVDEYDYSEDGYTEAFVGGIVGTLYSYDTKITHSTNSGNVIASVACPLCVSYSGGIAAYAVGVEISECVNKGEKVSLLTDGIGYAGGIAGYSKTKIVDAYNTASVVASGILKVYMGGVVGMLYDGFVQRVFSAADSVVFGADELADSIYMGSLVGVKDSAALMNSVYSLFVDEVLNVVANDKDSSKTKNVGTLSKEKMQSDQFAWVLNTETASDTNSRKWSRDEGYPVFASESLLPIYRVTFDIETENNVRYTNSKGALTMPDMSEPASGMEFDFWLDQNDEEFVGGSKISSDMNLYPIYKGDGSNRYKITFMSPDSLKIASSITNKVASLDDVPDDPKPAEDHTFSGWFNSNGDYVDETYVFAGADTLYPLYDLTNVVTFKNYDGKVLAKIEVPFRGVPNYDKDKPTKPSSKKYDYRFIGWNENITSVMEDVVYTAVFDSVFRTYRVAFMNDTLLIGLQYVKYGYSARAPASPSREGYVFVGWDAPYDSITDSITVNAVFRERKTYVVNIYDELGNPDERKDYAYEGKIYTLPEESAAPDYIFMGWYDEDGVNLGKGGEKIPIEKNTNIKARYARTQYHIAFYDDEEFLIYENDFDYGSMPESKVIPTKEPSAQFVYTFVGWSTPLAEVSADASYIAVFEKSPRRYTVRFVDADGEELSKQNVLYGKAAQEPDIPEKLGYVFVGWNKDFDFVKSDMTVKAVFEKMKVSSSSSEKKSSGSKNPFHIGDALENTTPLPQFSVEVFGRNVQVVAARVGSTYALMDVQGHTIDYGYVDAANFSIPVANAGSYFVRIGCQIQRIRVK